MDRKGKLNAIVNACERRFDCGEASSWKHSDFVDLSREILRDTKVNISPNTLKRIFGKISVDDDYSPQQATIEALEKFGGYLAPEAGQGPPAQGPPTQESVPIVESVPTVDAEPVTGPAPRGLRSRKVTLAVAAALLVFLGVLALKFLWSEGRSAGCIVLTSTEGTLPVTAFFDLQLPASSDSLFANFGDKSPAVYVKPSQRNIAHNYLYPGVFTVKLRTRQDTVATTKVLVRSNGWIGVGFNNLYDLPSHYFVLPATKTGPDSLFHIANGELRSLGLDTTSLFFTRLGNFTPVENSPDNFVFEATFKNETHKKGLYCRSSKFQITGLKGILHFKLVSTGCSSQVLNVLSERSFDGNKLNLSQFAVDLDRWNTVRLVNSNKHVSLLVNDKLLFTGVYKKSLGEIKGVFLEFEGNGFIKRCDLTAPDKTPLYRF